MKILVGLSGGVDSAVAAYLLKKQGHEVIGAMMSIWDGSIAAPKITGGDACLGPEEDDIASVKKIAEFLKIPYRIIDCRQEYKNVVLENFKNEYKSGRTPNPCVWCNTYIKFGVLPQAAKRTGISFDKFATGHYANIKYNDSLKMFQLCKAKDQKKDQTYFLYRLNQKNLSETLFPLGELTKSEVREIAQAAGIPVAEKPDSQDFYCGDYNDILQFKTNSGDIADKNGKILGKHNGIWNYTIGKRKGLGLSGGTKEPLYVINILAKQNVIVVGEQKDLYSSKLTAQKVLWNSIAAPKTEIDVMAKIRQQHAPAKAKVTALENNEAEVVFYEPQMSVTSGQSVVFYDNDVVLGGAIIK
ncbi:tRNA 2-thiouridine(34) synthase MnmA [Endomicrobium proavitum]|uniref:tRNA-specific 2-thiouridylase MnmA n=1 Tax=Endomicrobium proavitum TaxID=1408281 RepID=A0A0G3WG51_9BACT|nr:tRNA 2-thiouridine(34) synthase MnmA [Endomicrobium proavitum]AKL97606.1 tRNA-specific 2-thiouridylase MnmA [Endomicrobium proavitum]